MSTSIEANNTSPKPMPWNTQRVLRDRGWNDRTRAVTHANEFAVHQVVSEILMRRVSLKDATGKPLGTRAITGGELLDAITGNLQDLPGQMPQITTTRMLVPRPPSRKAKSGETNTSALKPARSRLNRLLATWRIYSAGIERQAWSWAVERGFKFLESLPEAQRAQVLNGTLVYPDSLIQKKPKTAAGGATAQTGNTHTAA
jgi:hypothetical protein